MSIYENTYLMLKQVLQDFNPSLASVNPALYAVTFGTQGDNGFLINRLAIDEIISVSITGREYRQFGFNIKSAQNLNNPSELDKIALSDMIDELYEFMNSELGKYNILPIGYKRLKLEKINNTNFISKDDKNNYVFSIDVKFNYLKE